MPSFWLLAGTILVVLLGGLFHHYVVKAVLSPLRSLPGPVSQGLWKNHSQHALDPRISARAQDEWYKRFGPNYRIKGLNWFDNRLLTTDPRAAAHILNHPMLYEKPAMTRALLSSVIGEGLLAAEGPRNRRQRKVLNPVFGPSNLKSLTPIFFRKAIQLRDKWKSLNTNPSEGEIFDAFHWFSRATFDMLGLTSLDLDFNAISEEKMPLYLTCKHLFDSRINNLTGLRDTLYLAYPILAKLFPTQSSRAMEKDKAEIRKFAFDLIQERREQYARGELDRVDILSQMVRASLQPDIPVDMQITDEDICNQINTFVFTGSDTTSLSLTWGFWLLAQHPSIQSKLRAELTTLSDAYTIDMSSIEETADLFQQIDKLPYLDKVVRELLRLIPPIHSTIRVALKDDYIPVSEPLKYERGRWKGQERRVDGIQIRKGEVVQVAIEGFNVAKHVFGEDAYEFNPDRWDHLPEAAQNLPGLFPASMSFGVGPRGCIGMRFAILEIKSMLYTLIPAFNFATTVEITKLNIVLTRPFVKGKISQGTQCPLRVTPVSSD